MSNNSESATNDDLKGWISVKDRLPDNNRRVVILHTPMRGIPQHFRSEISWYGVDHDRGDGVTSRWQTRLIDIDEHSVKYWQELPKDARLR